MNRHSRKSLLALAASLATSAALAAEPPPPLVDPLARVGVIFWQWALSIPTSQNPILDANGSTCMVGQRGSDWLLAGTSGGSALRRCSIPEGVSLVLPVANSVSFNSPNLCGSPAQPQTVAELRVQSAAFIDGFTNVLVEVDGQPYADIRRIKSPVFAVALPEENILDQPCGVSGFPGGVYSPSIDDGYYARLKPLPVGSHIVHFQAQNPGANFNLDVRYLLEVVPVSRK